MSTRDHPRAIRRMKASTDNALLVRRFYKFMDRFDRKEKSESNAVIRDGYRHTWVFAGGRGLIHNGRKP